MWGRIVFGTDGSPAATRAGEVAAEIARATSARLIATSGTAAEPDAPDHLEAALAAAEAAGMRRAKMEAVAIPGRAGDVLVSLAEERDAGLVVVARGAGQQLSGLTRWMVRHTPCDLLIVAGGNRDPHAPYGRILIASDGSATADRAARKGFDLAREVLAAVTLVFVGHPATGELVMQDTIDVYGRGIETDVRLLQGDPREEILRTAEAVDAELVVVGNKGLQGAKGYLLGSVPETVVEGADRDVLLCRTVVQIASELAPGEGGVIERRGEKLAVFVDDGGEQHLLSARCTHLGCTVAWNPGERTFDCPCHGSRFSRLGEVVNGPAARPLPPA
ncbi:MAG TPA: universal stress protein [Actinomycetota bacterium]|nr:universal stress protein [Actinomycetota bacterium]